MTEKFRIVSDGSPHGTKIYREDGSQIYGITKVEIEMHPAAVLAHIEIVVINPEIDIVAESVVTTGVDCG